MYQKCVSIFIFDSWKHGDALFCCQKMKLEAFTTVCCLTDLEHLQIGTRLLLKDGRFNL